MYVWGYVPECKKVVRSVKIQFKYMRDVVNFWERYETDTSVELHPLWRTWRSGILNFQRSPN